MLPNYGSVAEAPREGFWRSNSNEVGGRLTAQPSSEAAWVISSQDSSGLVSKLQISEVSAIALSKRGGEETCEVECHLQEIF